MDTQEDNNGQAADGSSGEATTLTDRIGAKATASGNGDGEFTRADDANSWAGLVASLISALRALDAFSAEKAIPVSHLAERLRVGEDTILDVVSSLYCGRFAVLTFESVSGKRVWIADKAAVEAFAKLHHDQAEELRQLAETLQG